MALSPADLPVRITIDVDGSGGTDMIKRHPLVIFTVLTFALTWIVWMPRAAGVPVGAVGQLWTWIPAVAALIAAALTGGGEAVRDLLGRLVRWRVVWWWYPVVMLGPAAFSAVVAGVYVLVGGSWQEAAPAAFQLSIPALMVFFAVLILTDGLGEELGWRGFALPRLLQRWPPVTASVILGLVWAAWHLPLLWTQGATLYGSPVWLLVLDICAKSILFTWVFVRTRESVLIAVLLHASTNLFAVPPVITSDLRLAILALIAEWLLVVIIGLILIRLQLKPTDAEKGEDRGMRSS
jgi:CAAX protease family protein